MAVPIPVSAGTGFTRVRVWVGVKLPMGYPRYALISTEAAGRDVHTPKNIP